MLDRIQNLKTTFEQELLQSSSLESLKKKYLGKESELMQILSSIPTLPQEQRKDVGREANVLRKEIEAKLSELSQEPVSVRNSLEKIDVTLPGKRRKLGKLHPHTIVMREMNDIFKQLGFSVYSGPEIETDEYVFERLNLPKDHPARSLQDTLVIDEPDIILRSHTSSVENRAMENEKLPLRVVVPGRTYRYESLNPKNHFAFHQYEGLAVAEDLTLADLKGTFEHFARLFFGNKTEIRIRCKYYPQVEPGCGLDILCTFCKGEGCKVCSNRGWAEMAGGGMVHANALRANGIDPEKYSGFAWGMGFERFVMQKFGVDDIRKFYDGTLY